MNSSELNRFIEIVHSEELLWNTCSKFYKDRKKKDDVWEIVGQQFNIHGQEAYELFKSLREKYRREKAKETNENRSGSGLKTSSSWAYLPALRFLDDCYKKRRVFYSRSWNQISSKAMRPASQSETDIPCNLNPGEHRPNTMATPVEPLTLETSTTQSPRTVSSFTFSPSISFPAAVSSPIKTLSSSEVPLPSRSWATTSTSSSPLSSSVTPSPPIVASCSGSGSRLQNSMKLPPKLYPSSRCGRNKRITSLQNTFTAATNVIVEALREMASAFPQQQLPYQEVTEFIRQTMIKIGPEDANKMEKEIMEIVAKFLGKAPTLVQSICTLKSLQCAVPDITLSEEVIDIGRSEKTEISDVFCSRRQLRLKADFKNRVVCLKVCGSNPSGLNGFAIHRGKILEAADGDIIEVVYGRYQYKISFPLKTEDHKNTIKTEFKGVVNSESGTWNTVENGKLLVYTPNSEKLSEKIAAYDLDGTIIGTKSGNVFPKDADDWKILYSEIPNKLQALHSMDYKIVIFTNQAGIGKGKVVAKDFQRKVTNIIHKLGVPALVLASTTNGMYRKPLIGMWTYLEELCKEKQISVSKSGSFYVGDAAGRLATSAKIKKDFSCADRLFALNLGIPFMTPEEHFLNERPREWKITAFNPKSLKNKYWYDSNVNVPSKTKEIILLVGLQGSGKSFFANKILAPLGYNVINRDSVGSTKACLTLCQKNLQEGKSCVVDNTNIDIESRKVFVEIAKKSTVKCRCFIMSTTVEHIKHNIVFRELTDKTHSKINDMVFNSFKKKFITPTKEEGFSEIANINFVPTFKDPNEEKLYNLYLTDK